jgi:CelD/BcsL family acetyltransferase involved in cellulose biosynthesis
MTDRNTRSSLSYETMPAQTLDATLAAAWSALADADRMFASPYFRPEYTQVVAAARPGVEVCVIRDENEPVGFYSFERSGKVWGSPVGGAMSNFQGVVCAAGTPWDPSMLVRAAGLRALSFHHQLSIQAEFDPYTAQRAGSPYLDLSPGWDGYLEERRRAGVKRFNALPREIRRLERELGPISFSAADNDPDAFDQLLAWKRSQYARTNARGSLQHQWGVDVLRGLLALNGPHVWGMLSTLRAGDRLIAVHAGMRTSQEWHYWYPAYDPDVGRHSPGLVLLHEMARWAVSSGIRQINLGKGSSQYKDWFATSEHTVGTGEIRVPMLENLVWRLRNRSRKARRYLEGRRWRS